MSDQGKNSQFHTLAAGFLGFAGVVGAGSLLILHQGGAAVKAPDVVYASVDMPAPLRIAKPGPISPAEAPGQVASSPAPLLPDEERGASSSAARAAGMKAAWRTGGAKLVVGAHLDGSSSASSSASASAAAGPKAVSAAKRKPFFAPKLDLARSQGTIASTVHYSVTSRAELMGRAAGPVYNFSGKSVGQAQSGQVAADNAGTAAGAMQEVDAAQKQLDSSNASAADKASLDQNLNGVRRTAGFVPAGQ